MIKHHVAQGSVDWSILRSGKLTASEMDSVISPTWKVRTGEMPRSHIAAKLAEAWLGGPLASFNTFDVEQGQLLESEARPWTALELNAEIEEVGFITTDDERVGCSPDGLIGEMGVEIKCPQPTQHLKTVLSGEVPQEHLAQIHGGMFVTGFKSWLFVSYHRRFPKLIIKVDRDEDIQGQIGEAVGCFLKAFDAAWTRLCELNGGSPKRTPFIQYVPKQPAFVPTTQDIPT